MPVVSLHKILVVTTIVAKIIKCKAFLTGNAILVPIAKLIFSITEIGTTSLVLNLCRRHTLVTKLFYQGRKKERLPNFKPLDLIIIMYSIWGNRKWG